MRRISSGVTESAANADRISSRRSREPVTRESLPRHTCDHASGDASRNARARIVWPKRNSFDAGHHTRLTPAASSRAHDASVSATPWTSTAPGRKHPSAPRRVISSAAARSTPSAAWTMNGIVAGVARHSDDTSPPISPFAPTGRPSSPKECAQPNAFTTRTGKRRFNSR